LEYLREIEIERLNSVPEGTRLVPEAERIQTLNDLIEAKDELCYAVKRFPGSLSDIKQTGKTHAHA